MNGEKQSKLSVVIAGGGCRTFWSLGVLEQNRFILPHVLEYAGVSAGAAMALAACTDRLRQTADFFRKITAENSRNFYIENVFTKKRAFPHDSMYRSAVRSILEEAGLEKIRHGAPVRILLALFKPDVPVLPVVYRALKSYSKRKKNNIVHGPDTPIEGLMPETVTAQDAGSVDELCDLVLASSCTPPVIEKQMINGLSCVDGGLIDNVPVRALSEEARSGRVLVLLSRPMTVELLPSGDSMLYLAPEKALPVAKWDYTSPEKVEETFLQGMRDGKKAEERIISLLSEGS